MFFVHESAIIDRGCQIGENTKIWHFSHLMSDCIIGSNCTIGQNVFIGNGVIVGNNVKIQNNVSLYTGVVCEDDVFLGPSCVFTNILNPRSTINRKDQFLETKIKRGVTIGANATIVCGNIIGEYTLIGAGSVITKDTKPYSLWLGNPAKQKGWVSKSGHKLVFDENDRAICPESNEVYIHKDGEVRPQ